MYPNSMPTTSSISWPMQLVFLRAVGELADVVHFFSVLTKWSSAPNFTHLGSAKNLTPSFEHTFPSLSANSNTLIEILHIHLFYNPLFFSLAWGTRPRVLIRRVWDTNEIARRLEPSFFRSPSYGVNSSLIKYTGPFDYPALAATGYVPRNWRGSRQYRVTTLL